jgi:hypothetical protein
VTIPVVELIAFWVGRDAKVPMKRYLVFAVSFDTRSMILTQEVKDDWEERIRSQWIENKQQVVDGLAQQYGTWNIDTKVANFLELGREPFSVVSFHNTFLRQCRDAFVVGSYYPALTGACALGERILNHLVLRLRDYHKGTASYKRVYDKESFDNWNTAIDVLEEWRVFIDEVIFKDWKAFAINRTRLSKEETDLNTSSGVADLFRRLHDLRNDSLHFRVDLDVETRRPALRAIQLLQDIVAAQFGVEGPLPWFIPGARGQHFIKKEFENNPFIREFYLPACVLVGPDYRIESVGSALRVSDPGSYEDEEISDERFVELLNTARERQPESGKA